MERLSKVLQENSKKLAITGAVALSVLSGVYLYKKLKSTASSAII